VLYEVAPGAPRPLVDRLARRLGAHPDVTAWPVRLAGRTFIVASGDESLLPALDGELADAVLAAHSTTSRGYWLVDRESQVAPAQVRIGDSVIGDGDVWCAAGPCALESIPDTLETAHLLREQGARALRMGLFKPRSSPYHFPGKGRSGLADLAAIRAATGLPVVTEVLDPRDVEAVAEVADCLQVDTRNMTNRALLAEVGTVDRPVLLMRGLRSSVTEWLRAAEFVFSRGNSSVVLCARGVASFDDSLAFQPDFGAIAAVRRRCDLPVIFDPSHSTGRRDAVAAAALAACAFGADGLLIESFRHPERLYRPGDGDQMYPPDRLAELLQACRQVRSIAEKLTP
jgi:3-deoxy-7-phosphoheptulonate synthase